MHEVTAFREYVRSRRRICNRNQNIWTLNVEHYKMKNYATARHDGDFAHVIAMENRRAVKRSSWVAKMKVFPDRYCSVKLVMYIYSVSCTNVCAFVKFSMFKSVPLRRFITHDPSKSTESCVHHDSSHLKRKMDGSGERERRWKFENTHIHTYTFRSWLFHHANNANEAHEQ